MVGFTVTGGGIVIAGFAGLLAAPVALLLVGAVALALLALALAQGRVALRAAWSAEVAAYNTECLWRLQRLWDRLPEPTVDVPESDRAMSDDLDLFGPRSVFHWLCRAGLPEARRRLRDWMLSPANPEAIRQRQVAARELADRVDLRERLAVETRLLGSGANAVEDFVTWAEAPSWYAGRPLLAWAVILVPAAGAAAVIAASAGAVSTDVGAATFCAMLVVNLFLYGINVGPIHDRFRLLVGRHGVARGLGEVCSIITAEPARCPLLGRIHDVVAAREGGAVPALKSLSLLTTCVTNLQLLWFLMLPFQLLFLIDFHVLRLMESWARHSGGRVRGWCEAVSDFEALASLAGAAHDEPAWAMPAVEAESATLVALGLAHPLLPASSRVANDVTLGPPGTFMLLTGSNMAGKSTLLRAIGVNAILARTGAPACVLSMTAPPLIIVTSMRVRDSLHQGVSFFMAELLRLRDVVAEAERARTDGCRALFLLDEILQGTNSAERSIAVERVVRHLVAHGGIGAISTHDLGLASTAGLASAARPFHLRETWHADGSGMTFDFILRPGVTTTTNALSLLRHVGLADENGSIGDGAAQSGTGADLVPPADSSRQSATDTTGTRADCRRGQPDRPAFPGR